MPKPKVLMAIKKGDMEIRIYDESMLPKALEILGILSPKSQKEETTTYQVQEEKISQQKPPVHFKGITEDQTNMILDLCRQLDISPPENLDLMSMEEAAKLISDLDHKVHHRITPKQKRYLIYLYKKLGSEYDEDEINSYTTEEASKKIDELRAELG